MREDKWIDTKAMIKQKFTVLNEGKEDIEGIPNAYCEFLEFNGPQGRIRLEYIVKPAVLDKRTVYSKLGKTAGAVKYTYSQDDFVRRLEAYKWDEGKGDWEEIRAPVS